MASAWTADVVVVGGGLVGVATAYELVVGGADVLLVEAERAGRATDAGAGILSPETTSREDERWFAFAQRAGEHHRRLRDRLIDEGVSEPGHSDCPLLTVAVQPGDDEWFEARRSLSVRRAPAVVRSIDPDEARVLFPPLGPVRAALLSTVAGRVDGRQLRAALLQAAGRRGLRTMTGEARALRASGERCVAVEVEGEVVSGAAVVLAGGAWCSGLAGADRVPVQPVKGQILHLAVPESLGWDTGDWPIVQPVLGFYYVPWPGGRVWCGGTFESAGYDVRVTADGVRDLLGECLAVAPGLGNATVSGIRVGLRPTSVDDLPVVGALPGWENVAVATGHGADGLLLGPYSGLLVARAVLEGEVPAELELFDPGRFARR